MDYKQIANQVKTLPRTTYEQRRPYYKDVEDFVSYGFITQSFSVEDITFSIRSPNKGDLFILNNYLSDRVVKDQWKLVTISNCIWMIDGVNLLTLDNSRKIVEPIIDKIGSSKHILNTIYKLYLNLYGRIEKATEAIESFCFEYYSRSLWKTMKGHKQNHTTYTGIPGSNLLGLNPIQQIWNSYNTFQDISDEMEVHWEYAKFVASASSPKGVKSIEDKDSNRKKKEEDQRQKAQDLFFYKKTGVLSENELSKDGLSRVGRVKSIEELDNEFQSWVSGEEDWHDRIVNDFKKKVSDAMEKKMQEYNEVKLEDEKDLLPIKPRKIVSYTPEQLKELKIKMPSAVKHIYDNSDEYKRSLYEKFIKDKDTGGVAPKKKLNVNDELERRRGGSKISQQIINDLETKG